MNIYLVLDGSDSIGASNFTGAKRCLANLIEKVDQSFPPFEMRGPYLDLTALTRLVSCVPRSSRLLPVSPGVLITRHCFVFNSDLLLTGGELWGEAEIRSSDICHSPQSVGQSV